MRTTVARGERSRWHLAILIPFLPVLIAIALVGVVFVAIFTACLHVAIWTLWCLRGRDVLFVYSDSPTWRDYIEERIVPRLGRRAVVMNWSQRKSWRFSMARLAFHHFGGDREFNPIAVVFRPFRRTRTFRFWQPFRELNKGRPQALHDMEREFLGMIGVTPPEPTV